MKNNIYSIIIIFLILYLLCYISNKKNIRENWLKPSGSKPGALSSFSFDKLYEILLGAKKNNGAPCLFAHCNNNGSSCAPKAATRKKESYTVTKNVPREHVYHTSSKEKSFYWGTCWAIGVGWSQACNSWGWVCWPYAYSYWYTHSCLKWSWFENVKRHVSKWTEKVVETLYKWVTTPAILCALTR